MKGVKPIPHLQYETGCLQRKVRHTQPRRRDAGMRSGEHTQRQEATQRSSPRQVCGRLLKMKPLSSSFFPETAIHETASQWCIFKWKAMMADSSGPLRTKCSWVGGGFSALPIVLGVRKSLGAEVPDLRRVFFTDITVLSQAWPCLQTSKLLFNDFSLWFKNFYFCFSVLTRCK